MSEQTARVRIAEMCSSVSGVVTAFTQIPRVLQDAQLPASVVFPGEATYDRQAMGEQMVLETRIYNLVLYVCNAAFDTQGMIEIKTDPFFVDVRDYFMARPGLELDRQGDDQSESAFLAVLLGDGGLQVGPYPIGGDKDYVQIRWRLQVQEVAAINYRD